MIIILFIGKNWNDFKLILTNRDLKPENVLYESKKEDSMLKVIDFGTSKIYEAKTKMNQKFGTVKIHII